jgi:hypothetical protein
MDVVGHHHKRIEGNPMAGAGSPVPRALHRLAHCGQHHASIINRLCVQMVTNMVAGWA